MSTEDIDSAACIGLRIQIHGKAEATPGAGKGRRIYRSIMTLELSEMTQEPLADAYRGETTSLLARQVPIAVGIFLVGIGATSVVEGIYYPDRAALLLIAYVVYACVGIAQVIVVRRRPNVTVAVTEAVCICQMLAVSIYAGLARSGTGVLLLTLVLFVTGVAVLFPWGPRAQLTASVGALVGYPSALAFGATPMLPVPYEVLALAIAVGLGGLGAYVVERQRHARFQHERLSEALLDVGRALDATLADPDALALQLTEQARRALAADWAVLFEKELEQSIFRATALSQAEEEIADEMRALRLSAANTPALYRRLVEDGFLEVSRRSEDWPRFHILLQHWKVDTLVFQAIARQREVIGVVGCAFVARRSLTGFERSLLAAIARQAVVALENARAMEEARRSDRLKSEFVASMSHELRTPLNVILGYTEMLLDECPTDAANQVLRETLRRIRDQSKQLGDLIQGMLDVNRLEMRRLPITIGSFGLFELMTGLRQDVADRWSAEDVSVLWMVGGEDTVFHSDRAKLEIILRNLIHNALKFTEAGSVTIAVEPDSDAGQVRFSVTDTGPGISAAEQSLIFDMFRQGSGHAGRGGVGLGLYIVKCFTEALGGTVTVRSAEGGGSRFVVSVPLEAPAAWPV